VSRAVRKTRFTGSAFHSSTSGAKVNGTRQYSQASRSRRHGREDRKVSVSTVSVLIVVDVEGTLSSNPPSLCSNLYLVDTNKFIGSTGEGQPTLATVLEQGDHVVWSVAPIVASNNVSINGFQGTAITDGIITPINRGDRTWWATFNPAPPPVPYLSGQSFQYSVTLQFDDGLTASFAPFLQCK
jgi:hypothetical protein